jgi:hypothetical protein
LSSSCIAPRCPNPREIGALFCGTHMTAPAGKRGGWISAERRRRQLAGSKEITLDASNIVKRLWVGSKPPMDRDLPEFDVLVLCAQEHQPRELGFRKHVIRVPLPDATLSTDELRRALAGSRSVAAALADGKRVLVTCHAGLNRSALVASLALGIVTRLEPQQIIDLMRARRHEDALHNSHFCEIITRFVGAARQQRPR